MSTVVESKIGKNFSKSMGRAKEKILQNLGKVDRTADEIFDDHVSNFNKQQFAATRLQKELNNYIRCIRACAAANKSLLEAVTDVYEPEWGDKDTLSVNSQQVEMLWNDFAHRLAEQVLIPLNTYQGQFPEMRKKIEKRGRKLVDFDGERHALQALQSNPRRAEAKLSRQRENLEAAKRTYEVLNSELHEELPGLYGSRIVFLVSAMSTLFASENIFHSESAKIFQEFEGVVERLAKESAKGTLNFKSSNNAILNNRDSMKDDSKGERSTPTTPTVKTTKQVVAELGGFDIDGEGAVAASPPHRPPPVTPIKKGLKNHFSSSSVAVVPSTPPAVPESLPPSDLSLSNNATTPEHKRQTPDLDSIKTTNHAEAVALANGESEEKAEAATAAATVNGDALPSKDTATVASSIEAEANMALAATTSATEAHDKDKKHEHQNQNGNESPNQVNGDESDESKHDVVEMPNSASITTNGDKHKLNGRHSSGDSHPTREHEEESEAQAVRAESVKTPEKIISSSISANENASPVKAASPTNNHSSSNANSNATPAATAPAADAPKEEKGVLYRVRATYRYQKEDDDELSFDAGEIIRVVEYDDPEEQEEGWLMGVKDNGEKGMFPANFTRPI